MQLLKRTVVYKLRDALSHSWTIRAENSTWKNASAENLNVVKRNIIWRNKINYHFNTESIYLNQKSYSIHNYSPIFNNNVNKYTHDLFYTLFLRSLFCVKNKITKIIRKQFFLGGGRGGDWQFSLALHYEISLNSILIMCCVVERNFKENFSINNITHRNHF